MLTPPCAPCARPWPPCLPQLWAASLRLGMWSSSQRCSTRWGAHGLALSAWLVVAQPQRSCVRMLSI